MREYRLTVTRIEPNLNYESDLEEAKARSYRRGSYDEVIVSKTDETQVLTVVLSEEEYAAAKRAVLEASK